MAKRLRRWDRENDDDPLGGMVNLFDVWIVVVVGLILALLGAVSRNVSFDTAAADGSSAAQDLPTASLVKLPRYRKSESALSGRGERLGTAYRLESGEVVYVPSDSPR